MIAFVGAMVGFVAVLVGLLWFTGWAEKEVVVEPKPLKAKPQ